MSSLDIGICMNCSVFSMNDEQYLMNSNRCSMGTPELWNEVRLTIPTLIRRSSAKEDHSHSSAAADHSAQTPPVCNTSIFFPTKLTLLKEISLFKA